MTHEERNTLIAILTSLLVTGYMIWRLIHMHDIGAFDGDTGLQAFGRTVVWVIPISIALTVGFTILGNILWAIVTGDEDPDFTVDERDRKFQVRGMAVTMVVSGIGFMFAMISLAIGWSAIAVFTLIYFAFAAGDITGNLVKLISYRAPF